MPEAAADDASPLEPAGEYFALQHLRDRVQHGIHRVCALQAGGHRAA